MYYDFETCEYGFKQMEYSEIKELEIGDEIAVCVYMDIPKRVEFESAIVVEPIHTEWDSLVVGTDKGSVDINSIYRVTKF